MKREKSSSDNADMNATVIELQGVASRVMISPSGAACMKRSHRLAAMSKLKRQYDQNVNKPATKLHMASQGMTDHLTWGLDQPIDTLKANSFLTVHNGKCRTCQFRNCRRMWQDTMGTRTSRAGEITTHVHWKSTVSKLPFMYDIWGPC